MGSTRREFLRRVIASSILLATGGVAVWDLLAPGQAQQPPTVSLLQTSSQASASQTSSQTVKGPSQTTSQETTGQQSASQAPPAGYLLVAPVSALNGKTSAYFNHPTQGLSLLLLTGGQWKAFGATCTHAPCTVQYQNSQIYCPCHGGTFDPSNGNVTGGPPPTRLPEFGVVIQNNNLYVSQAVVN